jgi:hypothetical protein
LGGSGLATSHLWTILISGSASSILILKILLLTAYTPS